MSGSEQDRQLSTLYRRTRHEQPPAQLDAAILRHAHDAVRRRRRPWVPQLALAASLVLGVGVALKTLDAPPPAPVAQEREAVTEGLSVPPHAEPPAAKARTFAADAVDAVESSPGAPKAAMAPLRERAPEQRRQRQIEAFCGDSLPQQADDPGAWRERIAQLNAANEHALARCLEMLYRQRFPQQEDE